MLKAALAFLSKLNEWLEKAIYLLAIFIVANMVLALFLSALIRYASGTGYDWFIELPPILTSWLVFPLLGPLLKSGVHIKVDILNNLLARARNDERQTKKEENRVRDYEKFRELLSGKCVGCFIASRCSASQ